MRLLSRSLVVLLLALSACQNGGSPPDSSPPPPNQVLTAIDELFVYRSPEEAESIAHRWIEAYQGEPVGRRADSLLATRLAGIHKRREAALEQMKRWKDPVQPIYWYYDSLAPRDSLITSFYLYFLRVDSLEKAQNLRLKLQHVGPERLYLEDFSLVMDGDTQLMILKGPILHREEGNLHVEGSESRLRAYQIQLLRRLFRADTAALLFNGYESDASLPLSDSQRASLQRTFDAFFALEGEI